MLRFLTCGESHGQALFAILDGMPAGLPVEIDRINNELWLRQQGYGRGNRQKIEKDEVEICGGVRYGITNGAPIGLMIRNRDWDNWKHVMSVVRVDASKTDVKEELERKSINKFRPGHADLAGTMKFHQKDIRDVLERASARETAVRVAVGALCRQFLNALDITVASHVIQVGSIQASPIGNNISAEALNKRVVDSELFCLDQSACESMKEQIKAVWQEGDSLGGTVEVIADGLPVGLGSYTQWDKRLDGKLAQALMATQAIKAVEIGDGVSSASKPGSQVHDALYPSELGDRLPFSRKTNRAGGIEGGMTNGERLVLRAYMKPIPTIRKGLDSLSFPGFKAEKAHYERSDVCAIAACSIVCKAMVCFVLAEAVIDKFGGDNLIDVREAFTGYQNYCSSLSRNVNVSGASRREDSHITDAEPTGNEDSLGEF